MPAVLPWPAISFKPPQPVILIHGAFGSRLIDQKTGDEYWPGNLWRILFSEYEDMALTIDDKTLMPTTSNLIATDVTDQVAGKDYYGAIIRTLEQTGGDCELTPARLLVEEVDGKSMVRLYPDEIENPITDIDYDILMLEPGDGRVTKPSLFARDALNPTVPRHRYSHFPLDYAMMLCESHATLTGNIHFQDNLLNVLLSNE